MHDEQIKNLEQNFYMHQEKDKELHDKIDKNIAKMDLLLFGDKELEIKGMAEKVNELHNLFVAGGNIKKAVYWTFAVVVATATFGYTTVKFFYKDLK